ncbi:MAG: cytochrome c, partial [Vicinamibacterales bacterium]
MDRRVGVAGSFVVVILALVASVINAAWVPLRAQPAAATSIEEHFKYGSIGTEKSVGVPTPLWHVLPIVFEDKLPNRPGSGYERLGFVNEGAPHGRPIGTTDEDDRVGLNCATCHVGTVRDEVSSAPRIVLGMPAHQLDLQAYA